MFCNFYFFKSIKFANISATAQAREKISTDLESLELKKMMYVRLNLKMIKFYTIQLAKNYK
jgi:hypothetical protein